MKRTLLFFVLLLPLSLIGQNYLTLYLSADIKKSPSVKALTALNLKEGDKVIGLAYCNELSYFFVKYKTQKGWLPATVFINDDSYYKVKAIQKIADPLFAIEVKKVKNQTMAEQHSKAQQDYERGWKLFEAGNMSEALKYFGVAIYLNPEKGLYYYARGRVFGRTEKYAEAIIDYSTSIAKNPKLADSYARRAGCVILSEKYSEAALKNCILDCTKAIAIQPDLWVGYFNLANAYQLLKNFDEAIASYSQALKLDPSDYNTYANLSECYYSKGGRDNLINSMAYANKAIYLDPARGAAYYHRAVCQFHNNNFSSAISDCTRAIEEYYQENKVYILRSYTYFLNKNYQQAIDDCDIVLDKEPENENARKIRSSAQNILQEERNKRLEGLTPGQRLLLEVLELGIEGSKNNQNNERNTNSSEGQNCPCRVCGGDGVIQHYGIQTIWQPSCSCYVERLPPDESCTKCYRGKVWCH
jgi:tetratricopeptide (TPR) repeat protein